MSFKVMRLFSNFSRNLSSWHKIQIKMHFLISSYQMINYIPNIQPINKPSLCTTISLYVPTQASISFIFLFSHQSLYLISDCYDTSQVHYPSFHIHWAIQSLKFYLNLINQRLGLWHQRKRACLWYQRSTVRIPPLAKFLSLVNHQL